MLRAERHGFSYADRSGVNDIHLELLFPCEYRYYFGLINREVCLLTGDVGLRFLTNSGEYRKLTIHSLHLKNMVSNSTVNILKEESVSKAFKHTSYFKNYLYGAVFGRIGKADIESGSYIVDLTYIIETQLGIKEVKSEIVLTPDRRKTITTIWTHAMR